MTSIEQALARLDDDMDDVLQPRTDSVHRLGDILPKTHGMPLPAAVEKFCSEIHKNFEVTAVNCDKTAAQLRKAADELDSYARDLRGAAPDVSGIVKRWITFERDSNNREKFLRTLFKS